MYFTLVILMCVCVCVFVIGEEGREVKCRQD